MDFTMGAEVDALRVRLRALIDQEIPAGWLGAFSDDPNDLALAQRFCALLAQEKLLCPAWPHHYGGHEASLWEQTAMREEMWAHHEPRGAQYMGVNWVGPTLLRHGTPDQQARHLPPIAQGNVIWCQGFSEPDAGSDLASLRTAARHVDGQWHINGQKIWTSYATMAQWCFLLVRTSDEPKKQQGLTIFLVPMDAPGITVRPIATLLGPHHLNEVFFDDVVVDDAAILGSLGDGWTVVREVLAFERVGIARYARVDRLLSAVPSVLGATWDALGDAHKTKWTRLLVETRRARLMAYKIVAAQDAGVVDPGDVASYRIAVTTLDQHAGDWLRDVIDAVPPSNERGHRYARAVEDHWRYSRAATVSSGSIEMQSILLARSLTRTQRSDGMVQSTKFDLNDDARMFGETARRAFFDVATSDSSEHAGAHRTAKQEHVLAEIGANDLRPRSDPNDLEAAAALCHAAGYASVNLLVAETLTRPRSECESQIAGMVVVDPTNPRASLVDEPGSWLAVDLNAQRYHVVTVQQRPGGLIDPTIGVLELAPIDGGVDMDVALGITLSSWTLSGLLDRAMDLTCHHVIERRQFGEPLAAFQGVQFALTDAEVARAGVAQLARYALWSIQSGQTDMVNDALALRIAALDAAVVVMRTCHQLHGAIGFCDETILSTVSRSVQVHCRVPWPRTTTGELLTARIAQTGLVGPFDGDRMR